MTSPENSKTDSSRIEPRTDQILTELRYPRADGTIEIARSPEEAIARCPYLGRLPLEQANVLLELSRMGQEMAAKTVTQPEAIETAIKPAAVDIEQQSPISTVANKNEVLDIIGTVVAHEITLSQQDKYQEPEAAAQNKEQDITKIMVATPLEASNNKHHGVVTKPAVANVIDKIASENIVPDKSVLPKAISAEKHKTDYKTESAQVAEARPHKVEIPTVEALPTKTLAVPTIHELKPDIEEPELGDEVVIQPILEPLVIDQDLARSDTKPEDPLIPLIEILGLQEANFVEVDLRVTPLDIRPTEREVSLGNDIVKVFEDYINERPDIETPMSIEDIQTQAENQPLEVSLQQLVLLISEALPENEALMAEIFAITDTFETIKDETSTIKFDQAMLSKILLLLKLIGYEAPEQSLLDLITRHDLRFVISAIRYLHELTNPHKRQEFSITTFLKPIMGAAINPLARIIGKTVMRLSQNSQTPLQVY